MTENHHQQVFGVNRYSKSIKSRFTDQDVYIYYLESDSDHILSICAARQQPSIIIQS